MRNVYGWSLIAAVCLSSVAVAQQAQPGVRRQVIPPRGTAAPARTVERVAGPTADQQIAACIHAGNRNEVELAKFAMDKLQSEEAKEFAAMMVKDHSPVAEKMAQQAGSLAAAAPAGADETDRAAAAPRAGVRATPASAPAGARAGHQALNWNQIHRELADQCLKSSKEELGRYEGHDFDKAYLGHQIGAHMKMLDELKVLRSHASSELQTDIEEGIAMTEKHLKQARDIMDEQKDKGSEGSSGRTGASKASKSE